MTDKNSTDKEKLKAIQDAWEGQRYDEMPSDIPDYGDVYTIDKFKGLCENGALINSDGHGRYCRDGQELFRPAIPLLFKLGLINKDQGYTHVIWYNK